MQKTLKEIESKGFKVVDKDFERPWGGFLVIEEKQAQDFSNSFFNGIHRFLPALFKAHNKTTYFISVDHRLRLNGNSKYGTFDRLFKGIKDLIKVFIMINRIKKDV